MKPWETGDDQTIGSTLGGIKERHLQMDSHAIDIDRVRPEETEALLSLYVDLFHDREPLTKCLGLSRERMLSIARSVHAGADSNPVSRGFRWVARDRAAAGRTVGFIVCDDPAAEGSQPAPELFTDLERKKMSDVLALLEAVRNPGKDRIGAQAGRCLHIAAIGVAPGYEGAGIATRLLQAALADAAARGFAHAFSECTSLASQKLHEKSGFQTIHCVDVKEFAVDGTFPFAAFDLVISLLWRDL